MKKTLLTFLIATLINNLFAQDLKVEETKQLTTLDEGEYFFPTLSHQGDQVFFTGPNYTGLYGYNLENKKIEYIIEDPGAGYSPVFSVDGQNVYYRTYNYKGPRRYSSLVRLNLLNDEKIFIEKDQRELSTPQILKSGEIIYIKDNQIKGIASDKTITDKLPESVPPVVYIKNRKIVLYRRNSKTLLQPLGEGIYIWPSISPQGDRILFTLAGEGTFISDLEGNVLVEIGRANAPKWSPDGNWIVFMADKDDGHVYTESEIFIIKSDGTQRTQLTNTPDKIEMYPSWGFDNRTIVYALNRGEIFLMKLSENK